MWLDRRVEELVIPANLPHLSYRESLWEMTMVIVLRELEKFPGYWIGEDGSSYTAWKIRGIKGIGKGKRGTEGYIGKELVEVKKKPRKDGYTQLSFQKDGKSYYRLLHRLVLETFIGPCPDRMECCHKDGNKQNNSVGNLYWGTRVDNTADNIRHGKFYNATKAAAKVNRGKKRVFSDQWRANISAAAKTRKKRT